MENLTTLYPTRAEIWLFSTILIYFLMNGAQIFETLIFVPKWSASPPENFKMLLDGQGTGLKIFWIIFHSLHEVTFILAIVFCWKLDLIRNWLLVLFAIHFAVRVWTLLYFAPSIIDFQKVAENTSLTRDLINRVSRWQTLNYVRVLIFIGISVGLVPLFSKVLGLRPNS